jgi:hypothetical protein
VLSVDCLEIIAQALEAGRKSCRGGGEIFYIVFFGKIYEFGSLVKVCRCRDELEDVTFFVYRDSDKFSAFIKRLCNYKDVNIVLQDELSVIVKGRAVIFLCGLLGDCQVAVGN